MNVVGKGRDVGKMGACGHGSECGGCGGAGCEEGRGGDAGGELECLCWMRGVKWKRWVLVSVEARVVLVGADCEGEAVMQVGRLGSLWFVFREGVWCWGVYMMLMCDEAIA